MISLVMCGVLYGMRVLLDITGAWTWCGDWLLIPLALFAGVVYAGLAIVVRLRAVVEYMELLRVTPFFKTKVLAWVARRLGMM